MFEMLAQARELILSLIAYSIALFIAGVVLRGLYCVVQPLFGREMC